MFQQRSVASSDSEDEKKQAFVDASKEAAGAEDPAKRDSHVDAAVASDPAKRKSHAESAEDKTSNETAQEGLAVKMYSPPPAEDMADWDSPPEKKEAPADTVVAETVVAEKEEAPEEGCSRCNLRSRGRNRKRKGRSRDKSRAPS